MNVLKQGIWALFLTLIGCGSAYASDVLRLEGLINNPLAMGAAAVLIAAIIMVMIESKTHINKAIPTTAAAGIIWLIVVLLGTGQGAEGKDIALAALDHSLVEYTKVMLFLMVAMVYVNDLTSVGVFEKIRYTILSKGFSMRTTFWITGLCAFWLSPVLDNLTTALVMYSVAAAIAGQDRKYLWLSSINIVVAANAGGAFSPAGDVTSTMVYMAKKLEFGEFIPLVAPALVCWFVPAFIMSFAICNGAAGKVNNDPVLLKKGAHVYIGLFVFTITCAILSFKLLEIPPVIGMMFGLALNVLYTSWQQRGSGSHDEFASLRKVEWDALVFFYGVVMAVAGIGTLGYLAKLSLVAYGSGFTEGNVIMGLVSAFVDNIPVMFAVLQMDLAMDVSQWQLVTLTTGTGGSIIAFGSAAGVALMSKAKIETPQGTVHVYKSNGKWTIVIALGYFVGVATHMLIQGIPFTM